MNDTTKILSVLSAFASGLSAAVYLSQPTTKPTPTGGPLPVPSIWQVRHVYDGYHGIKWVCATYPPCQGYVITQERRVKMGNEWVWQPPSFCFVLEPGVRATCMATDPGVRYTYQIRAVKNWGDEGINFSFEGKP
jgi:hypothetical protein